MPHLYSCCFQRPRLWVQLFKLIHEHRTYYYGGVLFFTVLVGCYPQQVHAQREKPRPLADLNALPPSPEAANLGRYGHLPVSYYTGAVQLSIPLAEVTDGPLRVPVSLSYNSTGNRVEDMASWIGLGWTLNAGGIVTRSVHGQADDLPSSLEFKNFLDLRRDYTVTGLASEGSPSTRAFNYYHLARGCWDAEPDLFSFNFNGYSGQFMFDWDGSLRIQSEQKVKIEFTRVPTDGIISWKITTPDGTAYTFGAAEITTDRRVMDNTYGCRRGVSFFRSAWHLTSIEDVNNEHHITFNYEEYQVSYGPRTTQAWRYNSNETSQCQMNSFGEPVNSTTRLEYTGLRVRSIQSSHGQQQVLFEPGAVRTDLVGLDGNYNANLRSLAKVSTRDAIGQEVRAFQLAYAPNNPTGRLTLATVQETGRSGQTLPPYRFGYSDKTLPAITSYAQDHWGYFNGAVSNTTLLPPFIYRTPMGNIPLPGANRRANPAMADAGLLTRVQYPTGGYSEFRYEGNDYGFASGTSVADLQIREMVTRIEFAAATCEGLGPREINVSTDTLVIRPSYVGDNARRSVGVFWGGSNCCGASELYKPYVSLSTISGTPVSKRHVFGYGTSVNLPSHGERAQLYVDLAPGSYLLKAYVRMPPPDAISPGTGNDMPYAVIEARYEDPGEVKLKEYAGGARIKEIRDYAFTSTTPSQRRLFSYIYKNNPALSSGAIHTQPVYEYTSYFMHPLSPQQGDLNQAFDRCDNVMRVARSCASLGTTQGSYVGYQEVMVHTEADGTNGKTLYRYTSPAQYTNAGASDIPFTPNYSESYMTGLLTQQLEYKKAGGRFELVKRTVNEYTHYSREIPGLTVAFPANYAYLETSASNYMARLYSLKIGHGLLNRTRQVVYASSGRDSSQTETRFIYDPNGTQLTEEQRQVSASEQQTTKHFYLDGFAATPPVLAGVLAKHAIPRLESVTLTQRGGATHVVGGIYYDWELQAGKLRQRAQRELRSPAPIPPSSYRFAALDATARPDERLKETLIIDHYDSKGNVVQLHQPRGPLTARVWGHSYTRLLSEVKNASYDQVAYTSFEPEATGRWQYDSTGVARVAEPYAGRWAYRLNGTSPLRRPNLPAGAYELLYWAKGGAPTVSVSGGGAVLRSEAVRTGPGGWEQRQLQLRVPAAAAVELSGAGIVLDELRLFPVGAQMTSMTYDPLVGVTSQMDPTGRTAFYEYDGLGRLQRVRDEQGRLLREQEYHYARP